MSPFSKDYIQIQLDIKWISVKKKRNLQYPKGTMPHHYTFTKYNYNENAWKC